ELGDHLVPVRRIAQDRGGDPAATRAGEKPGTRVWANAVEAAGNQLAALFDDWYLAGSLAFGGFVDQTARAGRGLAAHGPNPGPGIYIRPADTRDLAYPRSC